MIGFGKRLKKLRNEKSITQSELSEKLGVHLQTVSRWERDITEPDFSILGLIAETLGISLEKLLGQPEPPEIINEKFDTVSFGKGIASLRKIFGENQDVLAGVVGVSSDTVSKWERGLICPDIQTFFDLAKHFNISLSKLYFAQIESPTVNAVPADSGSQINVKKKTKLYLILCLAVFLLIAVALSGILPICLKPQPDNRTDNPTAENPNTDNPPSDKPEPKPEIKCEHLYEKEITAPTCTAQGYTTFTCSLCGYSYKDDYKPFLPHTEGDWVVDSQPTCSTEGSKHKECTDCQSTTQTQAIPTIEHNYVSTVVEPDGGKECYTLHTCTGCGISYQDNYFLYPTNGIIYTYDNSAKSCEVTGVEKVTDGRVEIPSEINGFKVTAIANRAFEDCVVLREIVIPDTVISIGSYAFHRCVLLQEVTIPDSVTELGDEAFSGCRNLLKAVLSAKLTRLKYSLFSDCVNLQTVNIPSGIAVIEDLVFNNCHKLKGVKLPQGLTSIGLYAFSQCGELEEIYISKNVKFIGDHAFAGCTSLIGAEFELSTGWTADGTAIDAKLIKDKSKASALLTAEYCVYIWLNE